MREETKCKTHRWERDGSGSLRTDGRLRIQRCNNCLAVKIVQTWDIWATKMGLGNTPTRHIALTIIEDPKEMWAPTNLDPAWTSMKGQL